MTIHRRHLLQAPLLLATPARAGVNEALAALERRAGGRLGVAVLDTGSGAQTGHRRGERFGMTSTFKLLLAAAVLQRADAERRIAFAEADLVPHSPVVLEHMARSGSMTAT